MPGGKAKWSKEEERMIGESSQDVPMTTQVLFYGNAVTVSALPLWLYWRVQMMDMLNPIHLALFLLMTGVCTWLVAYAYGKVKFAMRHKIAQKREMAISKEVMRELSDTAVGKKMTKVQKDEQVAFRQNEVSNHEAAAFSIFYNNSLFFFLFLLISYLLRVINPALNYALSIGGAGFFLAVLSTGS